MIHGTLLVDPAESAAGAPSSPGGNGTTTRPAPAPAGGGPPDQARAAAEEEAADAAAMALSSLSVVTNASRLRRWRAPSLPPAPPTAAVQPRVESVADRSPEHAEPGRATVVDPVCGMRVDPATATERRDTADGSYSFCSAQCAAAFDAEPDRYRTATGVRREEGGHSQ